MLYSQNYMNYQFEIAGNAKDETLWKSCELVTMITLSNL
jgi:hypothetical protein